MFSANEIKFMQRLVAERPESRNCGEVAARLCEHFNIGVQSGSKVSYAERHFKLAQQTLENNGLPVSALPANASRSDVASFGGLSEKSFSLAPHSDSVAVQFVGECKVAGHVMVTPPGAYLVMTLEEAMKVQCERILVVENLEPFRKIKAYRWIDFQGKNVMVVYRGDSIFSLRAAQSLVYDREEPIWAFMDFDLAGMKLAHHLGAGRLERLLLPDTESLRKAADTHRGRELFTSQETAFNDWGADEPVHPSLRQATTLVKELQSGVVQERMLGIGAVAG